MLVYGHYVLTAVHAKIVCAQGFVLRGALMRWTVVPGHPGYEITRSGRLRSKQRLADGSYQIKEMSPSKSLHTVTLSTGRKQICISIARLMLLTYVGPPPKDRPWALHRNDVRADNKLSNLYWGTPQDNMADAIRNGRWIEQRA